MKGGARVINEHGLIHVVCRSGREPALRASLEATCVAAGRGGQPQPREEQDDPEEQALESLVVDRGVEPHAVTVHKEQEATPSVAASTHSHVGEHTSNGLAERAVRTLVAIARTLKLALADKIQTRIPSDHHLMAWMSEHASFVRNKFTLGPEGKTAYARLHGRNVRENLAESGETIMCFVPNKFRAQT